MLNYIPMEYGRHLIHGLTRNGHRVPEWGSWSGMMQRCTNPNHPKWHRYGGRGIRVCAQWRKSFLVFYLDMGARPPGKNTLDRIDNDGDYTPENCRWASQRENVHNSPTVKLTEWKVRRIRYRYRRNGETYEMLSARYSVNRRTIRDVIRRRTWRHI